MLLCYQVADTLISLNDVCSDAFGDFQRKRWLTIDAGETTGVLECPVHCRNLTEGDYGISVHFDWHIQHVFEILYHSGYLQHHATGTGINCTCCN